MNSRYAFAFVILTIATQTTYAACYTQYDYRNGSYYTICPDAQGTDLRGHNIQNGTMWSERQNRDGTYHGQDGAGNYYQGGQQNRQLFQLRYRRDVYREGRGEDLHWRG